MGQPRKGCPMESDAGVHLKWGQIYLKEGRCTSAAYGTGSTGVFMGESANLAHRIIRSGESVL